MKTKCIRFGVAYVLMLAAMLVCETVYVRVRELVGITMDARYSIAFHLFYGCLIGIWPLIDTWVSREIKPLIKLGGKLVFLLVMIVFVWERYFIIPQPVAYHIVVLAYFAAGTVIETYRMLRSRAKGTGE